MGNYEATIEAARVVENYIEILKREMDDVPNRETSILISLASKEIDKLRQVVATLAPK